MPLVYLKRIRPNPYQTRQDYGDFIDLAYKILDRKTDLPATLGLIHVPNGRVVELDVNGQRLRTLPSSPFPPPVDNWAVELAEGHRRRRAFQALAEGIETALDGKTFHKTQDPDYERMPINLVEMTDEAMDNIVWDENQQRRNINPVEEAQALEQTRVAFNLTQEQLATRRGMPRSTVANELRLLKLPDDLLKAIAAGKLSKKVGMAFLPALDIKPHEMEQADPKLNTDPSFNNFLYGAPPTPGALRKRLLTKNDLTADEVRRLVERIKEACTPAPCQHCGKNTKRVRFVIDRSDNNKLYCENCWNKELTEPRYCPRTQCRALNNVKKSDIAGGGKHECWSCKNRLNAAEMILQKPEPVYRPLNLDIPAKALDDPAPAHPSWRYIPGTGETCYLCNRSADYHNNGWRDEPGANFHLCLAHYTRYKEGVSGHLSAAELQAMLDALKLGQEQPTPSPNGNHAPAATANPGDNGHNPGPDVRALLLAQLEQTPTPILRLISWTKRPLTEVKEMDRPALVMAIAGEYAAVFADYPRYLAALGITPEAAV